MSSPCSSEIFDTFHSAQPTTIAAFLFTHIYSVVLSPLPHQEKVRLSNPVCLTACTHINQVCIWQGYSHTNTQNHMHTYCTHGEGVHTNTDCGHTAVWLVDSLCASEFPEHKTCYIQLALTFQLCSGLGLNIPPPPLNHTHSWHTNTSFCFWLCLPKPIHGQNVNCTIKIFFFKQQKADKEIKRPECQQNQLKYEIQYL